MATGASLNSCEQSRRTVCLDEPMPYKQGAVLYSPQTNDGIEI